MSTRNRWSRWLAMFLAVAMMLNTQGMTALADVIGIVTDRKDQTADGSGMADPGAGEERENIVTFSVSQGASVTVDGADATNTTAMARDGRIVFTVTAAEGYQVSSVLVDRTKEARKNEATEAPDDYIIEGIKTDETVVTVETKTAETEEEETEPPKIPLKAPVAYAVKKNETTDLYAGETVTLNGTEATGKGLFGNTHHHEWQVTEGDGSAVDLEVVTSRGSATKQATITGVKAGTVTITHTDYCTWNSLGGSKKGETVTDTFTITVKERVPVTSVELQGLEQVEEGKTILLEAKVLPENTTDETGINWSSSDDTIARVDADGTVHGLLQGEATITAASAARPEVKAEKRIEVTPAVTGIRVSAGKTELLEGETTNARAQTLPDGAEPVSVTWSTDDESIASVDPATGVITAVSEGSARITATAASGHNASVVIHVFKKTISVSADYTEPVIGKTVQARAVVLPDWLEDKEVVWSSDHPEIVAVEEATGAVTALAEGTATITAALKSDPQVAGDVMITVHAEPEEKETHQLTVEFFYEDGGRADTTYRGQYLTGDEYAVPVKQMPGYRICVKDGDALGMQVFETLTGNIYEDTHIRLIYVPADASYTVIHRIEQQNGTFAEVTEQLVGKVGQETDAVQKSLEGYQADDFMNVTLDGVTDVVIEITYRLNVYEVTFHTSGGSYVPTLEAKHGSAVYLDGYAPEKPGYSFGGWYTDKECQTAAVTGRQEITGKTDYYAKWVPEEVYYQVVYWVENADDENYSYLKTEEKTGLTGSDIAIKDSDADGISFFTFDHADQGKKVAADGSAVVNVYYKRNLFTIKFWNGKKEAGTITAKYQQKIIGQWEQITENYPGDAWKSDVTKKDYLTLERMEWDSQAMLENPVLNLTKTEYGGKYTYTWSYYLETLDGTAATAPKGADTVIAENGKGGNTTYYKYRTVSVKSDNLTLTYDEDYYDIEGFAQRDKKVPSFSSRKANLYYVRSSFKIDFVNGGSAVAKTVSKKFEEAIADAEYTPEKPEALPEGSTFAGWYTTDTFVEGTQMQWTVNGASVKMPANNLVLYAKWQIPEYTVSFVSGTEEGNAIPDQIVQAGQLAVRPDDPVWEGYKFQGWYTEDETKYDFASKVTQDITLYGKWEKIISTSYTVRYLDKETKEPIFDEITKKGLVGSQVVALAKTHDTMIAETGSQSIQLSHNPEENIITFYYIIPEDVFYRVEYVDDQGETLADSRVKQTDYKEVIETAIEITGYEVDAVTKRKTLVYETSEDAIKENVIQFIYTPIEYPITYVLNGGTNHKDNPSVYTIKDEITFQVPTKQGFVFTGWYADPAFQTEKKGISKGSTGAVTVYAGWKYGEKIVLTANSNAVIYNGEEQEVSGFTVNGKAGNTFTAGGSTYTVSGVTASAKGTDAAVYPATFTGAVKITDQAGTDVTTQFEVTVIPGSLEIEKRPVTITGAGWDTDQPYTGNEYSKTEYTVEEANEENTRGLVKGQKVEGLTYELKGTEAGTYTGKFSDTLKITAEKNDVTDNYSVMKIPERWRFIRLLQ